MRTEAGRSVLTLLVLGVGLAPLGPAPLAAQAAARPGVTHTLAQAGAMLQRQQYDSAAAMARVILAGDSANGPAWGLLGAALLSGGHPALAVEAERRTLAFDAQRPVAMYNLGLAFGKLGQLDSAFLWLRRARDGRRVNLADIDLDPDAAPLRSDPRYAALKPSAADFARPFAEHARIIREFDGEHLGDQFGWIARDIGDVDGDHVHDFVASAPGWGGASAPAGAIYVYSSASGALLWRATGSGSERLGTGVEAAGDVNGDGVPDVVATAPGAGVARVYSGRNGDVLLTLPLAGAQNASGVGDVDGDGHADVLVGSPTAAGGLGGAIVFSGRDGSVLLALRGPAPGSRFGAAVSGATRTGHTLLVVGAPGAGPGHTGTVYVYDRLDSVPRFHFDGDSTSAALAGMFVSIPGDLDGDGVPDVFVSDWRNAARGPSTGRVYVLSGRDGRVVLTLTGETAGEGFGTSASKAGDVDGDGRADLVIGSWQYARYAPSGGRIYLYSGAGGKLVRTWSGRVPGETLGFDAVGVGDVDGDGAIDFLVTSAWSSVRGSHSGRVLILSGR